MKELEIAKILVVDDKEENRLVILNMIKPLGFEVTLAEDGQQESAQHRGYGYRGVRLFAGPLCPGRDAPLLQLWP